MTTYYEFSLYGKVSDAEALLEAAKKAAMEDGLSAEEAVAELVDGDGEVNIRRCLVFILDPGSLPGFEISDSSAETLPT